MFSVVPIYTAKYRIGYRSLNSQLIGMTNRLSKMQKINILLHSCIFTIKKKIIVKCHARVKYSYKSFLACLEIP